MASLFSSWAGVNVFGEGVVVRCSWPFARIGLDAESLTIDALIRQFQIRFSDIERLEAGRLTVRVIHHATGVPRLINISGWRLPGRLRKAIVEHRLPVQL